MDTRTENISLPFIQGGGEMGALVRNYDWSRSPVGIPETWPQSLRTTLGILLHSAFPMFLFWGKELICFYNDAFRPSLGIDGKHPSIGKKGNEVWPEIWHIIYPLINQVMTTGEPVYFEDSLVPFYRNGKIEDIYWTFSYSPAYGDDGEINGVFVTCTETTQKVEQVKKLVESDQRFKNLIHEATVGIIVLNGEDHEVEIVNEFYGKLIGKTTRELLGKKLFEIIPEAKDHFKPILDKVRTTGESVYLNDYPYFVFSGEEKIEGYINLVYHQHTDIDGTKGVMALCHDVTEQVNTRRKMEESEERFRLLADSMPQFVWAADEKGNLNYFNKALYEYCGKEESILKDEGWLQVVHPDEREENIAKWKKAVSLGEDFIFHHRFRSGSGEYRWQLSRAVPQKDAEGNLRMWIGTSTDIHDQKLFEEELTRQVKQTARELQSSQNKIRESTERLRAVFNHAQSGMFIFEPVLDTNGEVVDFRFVITNPTFASYVGQTPEVLNGELGSKWFPGYLENGVFDMYKETYLTGEQKRKDVHYNVDQLDIYLDLQSIKLGNEVLVTFTDYTELKRAQLELERNVEDLKRSNANLEDFAYAASHDMKEPIRKIHYFADKIRNSISQRFKEDESLYFSRMEAAAKRMGALIDDLLSYSQVSVKPKLFEEVDLNNTIIQVLGDLEIEIEEKNAIIEVEPLPTINGNQRQVQQAFQNLVSNAIKFNKPGVPPFITIKTKKITGAGLPVHLSFEQQQKTFYLVEFCDNGIGFDQSDAERIFNVFTRLHGNIDYRGTGIGLSIVRKVAENHKGYVTATGQPGEGACFTMIFPA